MDVYDLQEYHISKKVTQKRIFFYVDKKDKTGVSSNQKC